MPIVINGRFLTQPLTGVQRYALECVSRFPDQMNGEKLGPVIRPAKPTALLNISKEVLVRGSLEGHLWEQLELPRYARGSLLFNPGNTGPMLVKNQVVVIHDTAIFSVPQGYSKNFVRWYRIMLPQIVKNSRKIITVSAFSKSEIQKFFRVQDNKIEVIPESGEHILNIAADTSIVERLNLKSPFLLGVSSLHPIKNFFRLAKAVMRADLKNYPLVLVGSKNNKIFESLQLECPEHVIFTGRISDSELRALYEAAQCFVYPSLYEGFGLPPLEAMACGCPVVVSNTTSLPEVCSDAASYCDPLDVESIANAISCVINDRGFSSELRRKGLVRSAQLTWDDCATRTVEVLQKLI